MSALIWNAWGSAKLSTWTEWSITRSTGTRGLIASGSPPLRAIARAQRGQVDDGRDAGKVLQQHAGGRVRDLDLGRRSRVVARQVAHVGLADGARQVGLAQGVLQEHLDRERQPAEVSASGVGDAVEAVDGVRAGGRVERVAGVEEVVGHVGACVGSSGRVEYTLGRRRSAGRNQAGRDLHRQPEAGGVGTEGPRGGTGGRPAGSAVNTAGPRRPWRPFLPRCFILFALPLDPSPMRLALLIAVCATLAASSPASAQAPLWTDVAVSSLGPSDLPTIPTAFRTVQLDRSQMATGWPVRRPTSTAASSCRSRSRDGGFATVRVAEASVLAPELQARYPEIRTYLAAARAGVHGRLSLTPLGFRAMLFTPEGTVYVDPYTQGDAEHYVVYYWSDLVVDPALRGRIEDEVIGASDGPPRRGADAAPGAR